MAPKARDIDIPILLEPNPVFDVYPIFLSADLSISIPFSGLLRVDMPTVLNAPSAFCNLPWLALPGVDLRSRLSHECDLLALRET